ncbi:MAG: hypothetical protein OXH82_01155 [Candidatus Dadabacteria bacterium]|nr:hypothetical protein [Candidatus Dadabacteria bacterium]MDE0662526.1 hypothetical protein [Candidatus Dadabacteria bacterium]
MSEKKTVFIDLVPAKSGLGWKIIKGKVRLSMSLAGEPEPIKEIGTLILSEQSFHLNTGENLSEEEKKKILETIKQKFSFDEVRLDM